jgi:nucleoside-diphosphate-sugar epimerase
MARRCLVTGASGFLGGWISRSLAREGYDLLTPSRAELDIARPEAFRALPGDIDSVVHAAAFVPAGVAGPADVPSALATGALGTHNTLTWAKERNVRRFVYISSADVYAPQPALPVCELAAADPRGPTAYYGLGKLWGEQLCRAFRDTAQLTTVSLRLSQIHGAGMRPRGVVSAFWRNARQGNTLSVQAPAATGDFLYVVDACTAVACALSSDAPGPVYNIGSGREVTLEQLARAIWGTLRPGESPRIELGNAAGRRFVLDVARARQEIGYTPRFDLSAGLAHWKDQPGEA